MNCDEVRNLVDAYADNELDLVTGLSIERHLQTCAGCQPIYQNRLTLRSNLSADSLYFRAPADVQKRLMASLRRADHPANRFPFVDWLLARPWVSAAATLGVLVIAALVVTLSHSGSTPGALDTVAQEVLSSHIRSLMAGHLTDVTSTDQHTVKPWFDGKLDFIPPVIDLTAQGFPLLGGRLDYLENNPVAALVYGSDKHLINLFVWPANESSQAETINNTPQGYHLIHWVQGQMNYWAVADVEVSKLEAFAQLIRAQVPS
ncbi:MAG: anti-sigma factor family protein [Aggregatilineales bacterium]